jgi:hypothetical protein
MATVEPDTYEQDSAYGDEISSYSASLTSTAYEFPVEHGRTYHSFRSGRWFLPNGEFGQFTTPSPYTSLFCVQTC